jgi:peptide/nickel transport system substrate-binding protein
VYATLGIALVVGLAVFLIWWLTASSRQRAIDAASNQPPIAEKPSTEALVEAALPRGGRLVGSTDAHALAVARLTGASLVRVHRGSDRAEPWLAESWTASADNLIYALKLRPGVIASDGTPLTSDLATALLTQAQPQAAGKPLAIRAIDPVTVEIKFPAPFAPGLRVLDRYPLAGFGPFVEKGKSAFVRNPNYWHKAADGSALPYLDELVLTQGRPGQHDFAEAPIQAEDYEALKKIEQSGKARLFHVGPGLDADALWFAPAAADVPRRSPAGAKADKPWLSSETFRLAVSTAIDRREYCKQVFYGACDPIAGPVTPANVAWFNPDMPLGRADAQLARAMLAELGLRDRSGDGMLNDATRRAVRFSLLIRRDVPASARAATFIANALRAIGVFVDVTQVSASVLESRRRSGNYEAIYDRIQMDDTDPAMNLDFWLSSGAAHVWNGARSGPPADWERQIDQLMLKNASSFDRIERLQAFVDVQKLYYQHMPAIFFGAPHVRIMTSIRTLNAAPSPLRPYLLWNAEALAALK